MVTAKTQIILESEFLSKVKKVLSEREKFKLREEKERRIAFTKRLEQIKKECENVLTGINTKEIVEDILQKLDKYLFNSHGDISFNWGWVGCEENMHANWCLSYYQNDWNYHRNYAEIIIFPSGEISFIVKLFLENRWYESPIENFSAKNLTQIVYNLLGKFIVEKEIQI